MKYFFMLLVVVYVLDTYVYLKGHDTLFWKYKTATEKEYQRKILGLDEKN